MPLSLAVVKHAQEIDGKSTAIHGKILAPESVEMFTYPDLPNTDKVTKLPDCTSHVCSFRISMSVKHSMWIYS